MPDHPHSPDLERRTVVNISGHTVEVRMQVIGPDGGIEFWFSCREEPLSKFDGSCIRAGGVESHWKADSCPKYMRGGKPSHTDCTVTGGDCWHDGTSLWASERWMPGALDVGHEWVWRGLEYEYRQRIDAAAVARSDADE